MILSIGYFIVLKFNQLIVYVRGYMVSLRRDCMLDTIRVQKKWNILQGMPFDLIKYAIKKILS